MEALILNRDMDMLSLGDYVYAVDDKGRLVEGEISGYQKIEGEIFKFQLELLTEEGETIHVSSWNSFKTRAKRGIYFIPRYIDKDLPIE